jgi:DNA primase
VCDYSGRSIRKLVKTYGDFRVLCNWDELTNHVNINSFADLFKDKEEPLEQRISLPKEFRTLTGKTLPLHTLPIKKYLSDRGVTPDDVLQWKMGYCVSGEYGGRVIVPSFSTDGTLNYFVARSYNNHWKKYMNPPASRNIVFNDLMIDWESDIILVEGAFDAIKAGANAIPLLGSQLSESSRLFQKVVGYNPKVYLALDPDAEKKSARLIKKMLTYGINLHKIEIMPYSDVGEMTKSEFNKRKEQAKPVSSTFGDFFQYLLERTVKI